MPIPFMKGLQLGDLFYQADVAPVLAQHVPGLVYSAARLNSGSDVLGFDTPRSMDHGWGPMVQLFLKDDEAAQLGDSIKQMLGEHLPFESQGIPTHFTNPVLGLGWIQKTDSRPITHGVTVHSIPIFFREYIGCDPRQPLSPIDWLTMPEQSLRTVTAGRVFYDGLRELESIQSTLNYYPHDIWLYLLAAQWRRIDQEEPFMARTGDAGDELGSHVIAARQVRELMRLCFLMERQYAPYIKWFGTAFAQLHCAPTLSPIFEQVFNGRSWVERERALSAAYEFVAEQHNILGITQPLPAKISKFHDRPYQVIHSGEFVEAIQAAITDEAVRRLPPNLGSVNQFADSTDILSRPAYLKRLRTIYEE